MTTETSPSTGPYVDVQVACTNHGLPSEQQITAWVAAALTEGKQNSELSVRIVTTDESQTLNAQYRSKDKPTNVLSFPSDLPDYIDEPLLGDLVICADIVQQEAEAQNKACEAHWAHMLIHGTLHLQGYDHIEDDEAEEMEALETHILAGLGYPNPYENAGA
ncbi:rRNA maturation RNase YbeY [Marinagarivorans cellulosilyticus]|uniref:Endoribonuclease YbeY n=1 Tax=Marinagarivorans cellulosilyticus TaxID=2721545 RepID=A0AAN1WK37_9GAMM|nr:rRNA maturation RNase YbeY [Marinagarivorans cellulosilyticus]BCD99039.1 probable rRNA maturation factor [Marinagarivorans cellulosilyticus]